MGVIARNLIMVEIYKFMGTGSTCKKKFNTVVKKKINPVTREHTLFMLYSLNQLFKKLSPIN